MQVFFFVWQQFKRELKIPFLKLGWQFIQQVAEQMQTHLVLNVEVNVVFTSQGKNG
jgi:hypothetical protein